MSDIPEVLRVALADRYELGRMIGRGGMATVHLARDVKHGRDVAIKVLLPDLAASIGADRFLHEIEIAARLNHPHIVPLYDSGKVHASGEEFPYYVMPFIDGESLRRVLNRLGQLDVDRMLVIARQVASAIDYAHREGVLHRDIKPENILLADDNAFVVDFGVAKAIGSAAGPALTRTGFALGTPGYMSPEQAAGLRNIDARADVYGLTCVCYEMVIGEPPGLWLTEEAVRLGRFVDAEPTHRDRLDRLPGRLERVLARGLAMRREDRFGGPLELADALARATQPSSARFTDGQLRQIIDRAAEIQAGDPTEEGALSIGAVEQIAAQVGIPPEYVRDALEELRLRPEPRPRVPDAALVPQAAPPPAAPGVQVVQVRRTIEGSLPESVMPEMAKILHRELGAGYVAHAGGVFTWTAASAWGRRVHVSVTPHEGQTEILLHEQLESQGARIVGGVVGGGIVGGLFGVAVAFGMTVPDSAVGAFGLVFSIASAVLVARSIHVNASLVRERKLGEVGDQLVEAGRRSLADER